MNQGRWRRRELFIVFFFFNDTATTEIYTLSLHDALPILLTTNPSAIGWSAVTATRSRTGALNEDRKSTRLNSSHDQISYAVFCLKKKKPTSILEVSDPRSAPLFSSITTTSCPWS